MEWVSWIELCLILGLLLFVALIRDLKAKAEHAEECLWAEQVKLKDQLFLANVAAVTANAKIEFLNKDLVDFLTGLEKLVYLSEGDYVQKGYLILMMKNFGAALIQKGRNIETAEGSPVHRHGDNGARSRAEQAVVDWAGGLEKRITPDPAGNSD